MAEDLEDQSLPKRPRLDPQIHSTGTRPAHSPLLLSRKRRREEEQQLATLHKAARNGKGEESEEVRCLT